MKALEGELSGVREERDVRTKEKGDAEKVIEELKQQISAKIADLKKVKEERTAEAERVKALEGELSGVREERDVRTKEKGDAEKVIEELKQQISAKTADLEKVKGERTAGAERVKALEGELSGVREERDAQTKDKGEAQKAIEELKQQISAKSADLEKVRGADYWSRARESSRR